MSRHLFTAACAALLTLLGCVGDSTNRNIEQCVPGHAAFCACPGGVLGVQTCSQDGDYLACDCSATLDAGTTPDASADASTQDARPADTSEDANVEHADADAGASDAPQTDANDTADTNGALSLGAPCTADRECGSGLCGHFSTGSVCTSPCLGHTCDAPAGFVCFNRVCTPPAHCDLSTDEGVGPGCADARCGGCPTNSTCQGFEFGRYECVCDEGWLLSDDFTECVDVDECAAQTDDCSERSACVNTDGGFDCACLEGYWGAECEPCPGGADNACFGRGTCDEGSAGTGACTCAPRYHGALCDQECFDLVPAACSGADLEGADLEGRAFPEGDFSAATLDGLIMPRSDFSTTNLEGASFVGAVIHNTRFAGANIEDADFTAVRCGDADFSDATGATPNFSDATCERVSFDNAELSGPAFDGADMSAGSFVNTELANLSAIEANFTDAIMSGADLREGDLTDATLRNANLRAAFATSVNLTRAVLAGANLTEANLSSGVLRNADLTGATMERANLRNADLFEATLSNVRANGINLRDTALTGANLTGATFNAANFTAADLTGADLTDALLNDATLTDVIWSSTTCPDGTNSDDNEGTCTNNLFPRP